MNKTDKFMSFLESLKTNQNNELIDIVKNGFQTCLEGIPRDLSYQPAKPIMPLVTPFGNKGAEVEEAPDLKEEMKAYLKEKFKGLIDEREADFDIEAAIYWFANDYHSGQWSELYSILSTSPYHPGPNTKMESEGETTKMYYDALVDKFEKTT